MISVQYSTCRRRTGSIAPRAREHVVHQQHGHVAAHAVSLFGNVHQRRFGSRPQSWREAVELGDIGPRGKVRVATAGDHGTTGFEKARRFASKVRSTSLHEVLGVIDEPWMIGSHVVRHEVDDQTNPSLGQRGACRSEAVAAAEPPIDVVAAYAVGRADDVGVGEIGECGAKRRQLAGRFQGQSDPCRAAFPDTHQPHGVHAGRGHRVPLGGGNFGECRVAAGPLADIVEPGRGVQLVDHGIRRPLAHGDGSRYTRFPLRALESRSSGRR